MTETGEKREIGVYNAHANILTQHQKLNAILCNKQLFVSGMVM